MKVILAFLCLFASISFADTKEAIPDDAVGYDLETGWFYRLKDLPDTMIYRGTRSVEGEFKPMGWIGNCTATAVAPDVVFTASHCVTTGKRITFNHRGSGQRIAATCTRHPRYNTRTIYNDWAFCKLDSPLPVGSYMASFVKAKPVAGTKLLMEGFGAPTVGIHQWGSSTVRRYDGQDLVSCGPSTLGGGDSGGSLLKWTDDRSGADGFQVYAVNSRGNGSCDWYNEVTHPEFVSFAQQYEREKGVQLCGVSADCLGGGPDPIDCAALYADLGACWSQPTDEGAQPMPAASCREKYTAFGLCIVPPPAQ